MATMVKQTPPPPLKTKNPRLTAIPYVYASILVVLALLQLVFFENLVAATAEYLRPITAEKATIVAVALISVQVFALPFLLRLPLSRLARLLSALIAYVGPFFWAAIAMVGSSFSWAYLLVVVGFILLSGACFWLLNGPAVLQSGKKRR